jgi:thiamine-phosphate diphosphorylase / hydroxyethylthiazole kinase
VLLTGVQDYVSDGTHTVRLSNGHRYLGMITGSGCMVGTCCAVFAAAANDLRKRENNNNLGRLIFGDMFTAAVGG